MTMSDSFGAQAPPFHIGKHDSKRDVPLTDLQYGYLLNQGVSVTDFTIAQSMFADTWKRSILLPHPSQMITSGPGFSK